MLLTRHLILFLNNLSSKTVKKIEPFLHFPLPKNEPQFYYLSKKSPISKLTMRGWNLALFGKTPQNLLKVAMETSLETGRGLGHWPLVETVEAWLISHWLVGRRRRSVIGQIRDGLHPMGLVVLVLLERHWPVGEVGHGHDGRVVDRGITQLLI